MNYNVHVGNLTIASIRLFYHSIVVLTMYILVEHVDVTFSVIWKENTVITGDYHNTGKLVYASNTHNWSICINLSIYVQ